MKTISKSRRTTTDTAATGNGAIVTPPCHDHSHHLAHRSAHTQAALSSRPRRPRHVARTMATPPPGVSRLRQASRSDASPSPHVADPVPTDHCPLLVRSRYYSLIAAVPKATVRRCLTPYLEFVGPFAPGARTRGRTTRGDLRSRRHVRHVGLHLVRRADGMVAT